MLGANSSRGSQVDGNRFLNRPSTNETGWIYNQACILWFILKTNEFTILRIGEVAISQKSNFSYQSAFINVLGQIKVGMLIGTTHFYYFAKHVLYIDFRYPISNGLNLFQSTHGRTKMYALRKAPCRISFDIKFDGLSSGVGLFDYQVFAVP